MKSYGGDYACVIMCSIRCVLLLLLLLYYSAGVGRTGTFITIDHILEQREEEGVIDIPGVIQNLRQQRTKIVQTVV